MFIYYKVYNKKQQGQQPNTNSMIGNIFDLICQKQRQSTTDLITNFQNFASEGGEGQTILNQKVQQILQQALTRAFEELEMEKQVSGNEQVVKMEYMQNLEEDFKQRQETSQIILSSNTNATNSSQFMSKPQNSQPNQHEQFSIANQQLNMLKKQCQQVQIYSPSCLSKDFQNEFEPISSQYTKEMEKSKQDHENSSELEQQLNEMPIMTHKEQNPQEIVQLEQFSKRNVVNSSVATDNMVRNGIKNVRMYKNSKNLLKNRNDIKTQNNSNQSFEEGKDDSNGIALYVEREKLLEKSRLRVNHNNSIISNVVNYCQSLHSSNIYDSQSAKSQFEKNLHPKKELRQLKKVSKSTHKKPQRYKTQLTPINVNRSESKRRANVSQLYHNETEMKSQLKLVFEKKKKLQDKLKKLNKELQRLSTQQQDKIQASLNAIIAPKSLESNKSIRVHQVFTNDRLISHSLNGYIGSLPYKKHQSELQNSKKAIQFVEKISKESLKRRISHKKKVNNQIIERTKKHVCLQCSRIRCKAEVIEGEVRYQTRV